MTETECIVLCAITALVCYQLGRKATAKQQQQAAAQSPVAAVQDQSSWFASWNGWSSSAPQGSTQQ